MALAELRDLVRGIHPPVLAERGLDGAVQALALTVPPPVTVDVELPGRPPAPVESAAYFAVAEVLANVAKHSRRAPRLGPHPARRRTLTMVVGDDGARRGRPGGAAPGLRGIERRLAGIRWHDDRGQPARRAHRRDHGAAVRVVIAEDLALLRDGLTRLLQAFDFEVVAAVDNGPGAAAGADSSTGRTSRSSTCGCRRRSPTRGCRPRSRPGRRCPGLPVLVLSQHVEQLYARELLTDGTGGVGYLLKDRVSNVGQFIDAVKRVADGGTVMDPEVVAQLLARRRRDDPLADLTPREREVLGLMAEGRSNAAIAGKLFVTEKAVSKHINSIFTKLGLPPSDDDNRRVLAVLAYLNG